MKRGIIVILILVMAILVACGAKNSGSEHANKEIIAQENSKTQIASEHNGAIKAVVSKNCNYVYHMLSVANCGYDNAYGQQYKSLHSQTDLQTLKKYETYLTVVGGEHSGELYVLCVALPASLRDDISLPTYFEAIAHLFEAGDIDQNFARYQDIYEQSFPTIGATVDIESLRAFYESNEPLKQEIVDISKVMSNNYSIYSNKVWKISEQELSAVVDELNQQLSNTAYMQKWEEQLNCNYEYGDFLAVICNSLEHGPNCIDISFNKDVFYHSGTYASTAKLISHEFGIYLLKDVLADTEAFQDFAYYNLVEGLAEYYNTIVSGGHTDGDWGDTYIDFYRQLHEQEPAITAEEMFERAVDHFMPDAAEKQTA